MTPDDWHRAMQNEAEVAPESQWAHDTCRAARRARLSRGIVGHLLLGQTLFTAVMLLSLSPTEPGPWLALGALGLSFAALRQGDTVRAALAVAPAWGGLASTPSAQEWSGMTLPAPGLLLVLTVAGLAALPTRPYPAIK